MKKLLLMILPAFICAGSLIAQTSTVSGEWERGKTKADKMYKIVEDGFFLVVFFFRYFRIVIHFI